MPVALLLGQAAELLEPGPAHELGDHHPLVGERGDDVGDDDERVAAVDPGQRALVLGLELVVELLLDPRADLLADGLGVQAGGDALDQAQDQAQVLHVGAHRGGHARVLDLDRHLATVAEPRPVDLADRRGGDRLLVELVEDVGDAIAQLLLDHLAHVAEGDRGRGVAQDGELALELLAVLLGHHADVEEGQHLPHLHRGALHRAQGGDDLLGGLELAPLERHLLALGRARHVGGAGAGLPDHLSGRQTSDPGSRVPPGRSESCPEPRLGGQPRLTCEPGTMSSEPSGQRTHALWPPS